MRFGRRLFIFAALWWAVASFTRTPHVQAQAGSKPAHPLILGYERFVGNRADTDLTAGRLLVGEMNCTACHKADDAMLMRKQAPILDGVGQRVRAKYLQEFLADPHGVKPGTAMPNMLETLPMEKRAEAAAALTHFLASTGTLKETRPQPRLIAKGQQLYHEIGCAVCHGPQGRKLKEDASVIPLGDLAKKYSIGSLAAFLLDPHRVRPSGRMPSLNLKPQEALEIANFLLVDLKVAGSAGARLRYSYFEHPSQVGVLADFAKLKPVETGMAAEFDVELARRRTNVALKFEGFLRIDNPGEYTFHLSSDDGSKLSLGGKVVVDNDGIHATEVKKGTAKLDKGIYPLEVMVFQAGGEFTLAVDVQGPGFGPVPLVELMYPTREAAENPAKNERKPNGFVVDAEQAKKGRQYFASLGCAACHHLNSGQGNIASALKAPALTEIKSSGGCLADSPPSKAPRFSLSDKQRRDLVAALGSKMENAKPPATVDHTLAAFNCYACHERGGKGGVETGLNEFFKGTQPEMGDEGRVPPHLNGVGAKLKPEYLKKILANGINDRPYMLTRMPKFGENNVGHLQKAFETLDEHTLEPFPPPKLSVTVKKAKSEGRFMVGNQAFGCVKCHNFREHKSGGVQGMNMTIMTDRLRHDWFARYLLDPNKFRPQTRMPAVWPFGISQLPKVLGGDTNQQIEAVWLYLSDGNKAALPFGVGRQPIPLEPVSEAIIYRNFIEGAGARAIGVGYPEHINLTFDANDLRFALLWHNQFMDASRHWTDRGVGAEPPLGDGVLHLPVGPSFAILGKKDQPWPTKAEKDKGHKFRGYVLDDKERPTFKYSLGDVQIEDFMLPVPEKEGASFKRSITVDADSVPANLYFRAIAGPKIVDQGKGWFEIGELRIHVENSGPVLVRTIGNQMEVLVPITEKKTLITQEYHW